MKAHDLHCLYQKSTDSYCIFCKSGEEVIYFRYVSMEKEYDQRCKKSYPIEQARNLWRVMKPYAPNTSQYWKETATPLGLSHIVNEILSQKQAI